MYLDAQIASCTDIFQILFMTTFHRKILQTVCVYFEDTVICLDKIVIFSHWGKQIDMFKTYSMKQPDLYHFKAIKMTSQAGQILYGEYEPQ